MSTWSPLKALVTPAGKPVTVGPAEVPLPTLYVMVTIGVFVQTVWLLLPPADSKVTNVDKVPNDISSIPKSLAPAEVSKSVIEIFTVLAVGPDVQLP